MGEITEALRRAKLQQEAQHAPVTRTESEVRPQPQPAPAPATPTPRPIVRARPETQPPVTRPTPIAEPIRLHDDAEESPEIVGFPRIREGTWPARAVLLGPREPYTERFRRFAVRVRSELEHRDTRSVLITSARRSEGKTFTSCNLVLALASMPMTGRIALVELDLRRPAVAMALGITPRIGIEAAIAGEVQIDAAKIRTELPSLDLYLVREPRPEAHQLLAHPNLPQILRHLVGRYDMVIIDCPPVLAVPDVSLLLDHVGGCIAVVRAGTSRVRTTRDMFNQLPRNKLMGVFANDVSVSRAQQKFDYYAAEDDPR
jgi:Mrp family chromosome partitioning ATPase